MIVTIDTDKKELIIEKATIQEIYKYTAQLELLDYTIISKIKTLPSVGCDFDIDKHFKLYYNII